MNLKNCSTCKHSRHDNWDDVHCHCGEDGVHRKIHMWIFGAVTRSQKDLIYNLGCGSYEKAKE